MAVMAVCTGCISVVRKNARHASGIAALALATRDRISSRSWWLVVTPCSSTQTAPSASARPRRPFSSRYARRYASPSAAGTIATRTMRPTARIAIAPGIA